ncbi:type I restriction endonuclease subunit R [Desulfovibrio sp. ZJ369]|uniref:type I restriction endonuclease subunit R n=1 Tax=Desulfovibrio sp. ZJ369 TaxID=2709793 RepID=UPI0013EABF29|nr:type I restriction endonuclease subunit R [Desulfovibrio sp. ZJ369]
MAEKLRSERVTQNRVIDLFQRLGYAYLGNWKTREKNRAVEYDLLQAFLLRQGVSPQQIDAAWLKISQAVAVVGHTLYEANRNVYGLLRYGVQVLTGPGQPHETVHLIDWDHPENNDFALAEEVTLTGGADVRRPDLVLYLNGFAVGIIELKRASVTVGDGIRQLISNQRSNPDFFVASQLLFAGSDTEGLHYGTTGAEEQFYLKWKEKTERTAIAPGCHLDAPLARMCGKERLLDWIHDCVIFDNGIKKVPRPHQYFGLKAAQERIARREGGVIWHTQGSGKSILMVMLARWLLEHKPDARVLIVTDRTELDAQIAGVMQGARVSGYVKNQSAVISRQDFRAKLEAPGPRLLCALIHKFDLGREAPPDVHGDFYVLVDECHRTQSGDLHKQMKEWLPNAIFIGFTGTPLLRADARSTRAVFGTNIHTYKFPEAVADRVVLDLKYEARTVPQELASPEKVDAWFTLKTTGLSDYQKALLRRRWGTMERILSSRERKGRIVRDICMDFDLKPRLASERGTAMLVADSIYDACQYFREFQNGTPLSGKCGIITSYEPAAADISREPEQGEEHYKFTTYRQHVLSPALPTTARYEEEMKRRFREEPANCRLLIVVGKLLVGFDAPTCSYIYLDKKLRDHSLFQAICRTNRLNGEDKDYGHVVDYKEQFKSVQDSIAVYSSDELEPSGGDAAEDNVFLQDLLKAGREKLEEAREALKQLCDPVPRPREMENFYAFFCGDASQPEDLEAKAASRDTLYKLTARLLRAYSDIAQQLLPAGYSPEDVRAIEGEIRYFTELRDAVKKYAGEELDLKPYERDMRHLIDMYIRADEPRPQGSLEEYSLLDLIVKTGIHDAIARKWNEKTSRASVAEGIVNNIRKAVNDKKETDPKFYEKISKLLTDLLEARKRGALAYEEFLKKMEELAARVASGDTSEGDTPEAVKKSPFTVTVFNNLASLPAESFICPVDPEEKAALALQITEVMDKKAPDKWRGVASRENIILGELYPLLHKDEKATRALFEIIKAGPFYV